MEWDSSKLLDLLKRNFLIFALISAGLIFFVVGLIQSFSPMAEVEYIPSETSESAAAPQKIWVDVAGAVEKPGVYTLNGDDRIQDALLAAGGLADNADREVIAKTINLAQKVTDGVKLYFPIHGEMSAPAAAVAGESSSGLININTASASQLDTLPGIGPKTAEKIISARPYTSVDEMLEKKAVSKKVLDDIREKVSVY